MLLPSEGLLKIAEMAAEAVWVEPLAAGGGAIVFKAAETVSKALASGVASQLSIAVIRVNRVNVLCLGVEIDDEPEHPFKVISTLICCRDLDDPRKELRALETLLSSGKISLHGFNELNHVAVSADCELGPDAARAHRDLVAAKPYVFRMKRPLAPHRLFRACDMAMDAFQRHLYRGPKGRDKDRVKMSARLPLGLKIRPAQEIVEAGPTWQSATFLFGDRDEGERQTRGVEAILLRAFPSRTYCAPEVKLKQWRELTDVLVTTDTAVFLFESKAVQVFDVDPPRTSADRVATIRDDIKKGMKQLPGAFRSIKDGRIIVGKQDRKSIALPPVESSARHGIIVVSEMYSFVDWRAAAAELIELGRKSQHQTRFHILDLLEVGTLVEAGRRGYALESLLEARWLVMQARGTARFRLLIPGNVLDRDLDDVEKGTEE